ncbi:orotidine 5'-phosphate decarboxylase / HUMPS family protein [Candidatus Dependentiae bacterium]
MKLQISFDLTNLTKALEIAKQVEPYADIIEIGSNLIYHQGVKAIAEFKKQFPEKEIFADLKLVDKVDEIIKIYSEFGANHISILAGTSNAIIQNASKVCRSLGIKIALDLIDAYSMGQSAMDAKALDVDTIIFHGPQETTQLTELLEEWQNVKGNSTLPIFIAGNINKNNIHKIIPLKPKGIIINGPITNATEPAKEAEYFYSLIKK